MAKLDDTDDPGNPGLNLMAFKFDETMDWLLKNDPEGYRRRMNEINGVTEETPVSSSKSDK